MMGLSRGQGATTKYFKKEVKHMEKKLLIGANEIRSEYGQSRTRAYEILNDKTLPVIRIGKRLYVRRESFEKWLDEKQVRPFE